jgi:hypothetical protein
MRLVTYVSSSPVITYLRWDCDSDSACFWMCVRVGMRPWYMVVRFLRSMYAACPSIRLLGSTLDMSDWCFLVEEWECYF